MNAERLHSNWRNPAIAATMGLNTSRFTPSQMQNDSLITSGIARIALLAIQVAASVFTATLLRAQDANPQSLGNLSPAAALQAFETEPGFEVELVAAEPLTIDPVAIAFDEQGRLFVAENRDYPTGAPDGQPLGVVALLEDRDGDGRVDHRTEFASGIKFPNGVMPWRGGVIVTASPDVWWFADQDGDGRAEVKELLLTGFDTGSTSQLRANDPTLGPDSWVYIAGGLRGGKVNSPKQPGVVLDLARGDLRFNPDTGEMKLTEGKSQFGLAFDDAGNRFACMNRVQVQHAPLPARYLARNPHLNPPRVLHNCPEIADNTLMTRSTAGAARYFPISANITTADSHVGTYSAACAIHIYHGQSLPHEYRGAAFSCDPTGNLVRGDRLEKAGGTFAARRIHEGTEALRSRDNWFRPVFIADGPEGALYIADMYRKVIEHPEYLPEEVRKHTDFAAGNDKGRIWRLSGPKTQDQPRITQPDFTNVSPEGLIASLSSEIPWERDTAFRLLMEAADQEILPLVKKGFAQTRQEAPAVLHLQLLQNFNTLDESVLERALQHSQPGVRRNALRFSEPILKSSGRLRELALRSADDSDPHVRFQAALSLGELNDPEVIPALARIARKQADDPWTRAAIQSALTEREAFLTLIKEIGNEQSSGGGVLALIDELGRQVGVRSRPGAEEALQALQEAVARASIPLQIAALAGFLEVVQVPLSGSDFNQALYASRKACANEDAPPTLRAQAIRLLAHDDSASTTTILMERLVATEPDDIQVAAARALLQPGKAELASVLLGREAWRTYSPTLRMVLLNLLTSRDEFAGALLNALESGAVPAGVLTPANRTALRRSKNPSVKIRAEKLLEAVGADRRGAFDAARASLKLLPAPAKGRAVFQTHCAACHRLNQEGVAVGPDLFDIRNQPKESILYHIIVPEAEIAPNFVSYECETTDGRTLSGLLASESAGSITLRMAQGVEEIIPRSQIQKLTASQLSLMPQEFEKTMTQQEMADLLAYLRGEQ